MAKAKIVMAELAKAELVQTQNGLAKTQHELAMTHVALVQSGNAFRKAINHITAFVLVLLSSLSLANYLLKTH